MLGKATLIEEIREELQSSVLTVVDAGNLFFKPLRDKKPTQVQLAHAFSIARAYKEIGFDAVGLSHNDLLGGPEFLSKLKEMSLPVLSANLMKKDGSLFFAPFAIKNIGDANIGIIGVTGTSSIGNTQKSSPVEMSSWQSALSEYIHKIKDQCQFIILLSSLTDKENRMAVELFPQINLIISTYPNRSNLTPQILQDSLVTQVTGRGKYFGRLDLEYTPGSVWADGKKEVQLQKLLNKLGAVDWQISNLQKKSDNAADTVRPGNDKKLARLTAYRKTLETQRQQLEQDIAKQHNQDQQSNSFNISFLPVYPVGSGTHIDHIIEELREEIQRINTSDTNVSVNNDHKDKALLSRFIAGSETCLNCHEKQYYFWRGTAHSSAFNTLKDEGRPNDPDCLSCHVTGGSITALSPYEDRQLLLSLPESRQSVGCETCHGPALAHSKDSTVNKPLMRVVPDSVCLNCHTPERDNTFNYSVKYRLIVCPAD